MNMKVKEVLIKKEKSNHMTRWRPIFNGDYMVSDGGEVWSNKTNRMLTQSLNT